MMTVETLIIDDDQQQQQESSIDQEQYFIWKKNAPILYDHLQTTSLLWPSLTVQFFPDVELNLGFNKYRLLTGTFTSQQQQEYLNISDVKVKTKFDINPNHYDPDKQEIIDNTNSQFKGSILQKITHDGEVNKARYMPQNPDLISTINGQGKVSIFDRTKHPSQPSANFKNEICLDYHKQDGFGLSWNTNKEGELLTGASDGLVCLYDITKWNANEKLQPSSVFVSHDNGVNDLKFLYETDSMFSSCGEDCNLKIWDKRKPSQQGNILAAKLSNPVNSIAPNPLNQFILACGDNEGNIKVFDLRNIDKPVFDGKQQHSLSISCLEWNFHNGAILASGSEDKTVKLWDMSRQDNLIFVHGGHLFGVSDISWNPNDEKMLASVSDDNTLHVWKPSL